jgi:hypothetical protein
MRFSNIVFALFTLIVTTYLMAGCSSKVPNQSAVDQAVRAKLADPIKTGFFEVESIKKSNGHPDGENKYSVEAEIKFKFKSSYADLRRNAMQQSSGFDQSFETEVGFDAIKEKLGNFAAGEEKTFKLNYKLVKTEKGWLVEEGQGWLGI